MVSKQAGSMPFKMHSPGIPHQSGNLRVLETMKEKEAVSSHVFEYEPACSHCVSRKRRDGKCQASHRCDDGREGRKFTLENANKEFLTAF